MEQTPSQLATTADLPMPAVFQGSALKIIVGAFAAEITAKQIEHLWDALSHFPDRRAGFELGALADRLNAFASYLVGLAADGGRLDLTGELERFARRHVSLTRRAWAMEGRCMSSFVVGPAKFPVERNRKRLASSDNAFRLVRDHSAAARKSAERTAFPHGLPGGPIRANNPDAPALIRDEIAKRRAVHEAMKAANAAIRSAKSGDVDATVQAVVDATGWRENTARRCVVPPETWMRPGFDPYQLARELAEIKRLEDRLAAIERNRARGDVEREYRTMAGRLRVVENGMAARIQLFFDGKPEPGVRAILKRHGMRWAPSEGAWQRHLNEAGRYTVERIVSHLAGQLVEEDAAADFAAAAPSDIDGETDREDAQ